MNNWENELQHQEEEILRLLEEEFIKKEKYKKKLEEEERLKKEAIKKAESENKIINLSQAKKKIRFNDKKELNDIIADFIMTAVKDKTMTVNKISLKTGQTISKINNFLKIQGIKIKRY